MKYVYVVDGNTCFICEHHRTYSELIGWVDIDETGAWTPHYANGVKYLPINEAVQMIKDAQKV